MQSTAPSIASSKSVKEVVLFLVDSPPLRVSARQTLSLFIKNRVSEYFSPHLELRPQSKFPRANDGRAL